MLCRISPDQNLIVATSHVLYVQKFLFVNLIFMVDKIGKFWVARVVVLIHIAFKYLKSFKDPG